MPKCHLVCVVAGSQNTSSRTTNRPGLVWQVREQECGIEKAVLSLVLSSSPCRNPKAKRSRGRARCQPVLESRQECAWPVWSSSLLYLFGRTQMDFVTLQAVTSKAFLEEAGPRTR